MGHKRKTTTSRIVRFLIVGAGNTVTNFVVLNGVYYGFHANKILSSVIATSCAILLSFTLNRHYVFRDKSQPMRKLALFSAVSALGTLIVQTSIYTICISLLRQHVANSFVAINLSLLIASCGVMLWNYNGYRLIVFKQSSNDGAPPSFPPDNQSMETKTDFFA